MAERTNFGKLSDVIEAPDLVEIQLKSYVEFLQLDLDPYKRKDVGLQAVLKESFPVESYDGQIVLDFVKYEIEEPKLDYIESML